MWWISGSPDFAELFAEDFLAHLKRLTENTYDMHQMIPDILIANVRFMEGLSDEDRAVFEEGLELMMAVQKEEFAKNIESSKEKAEKELGVKFNYPDVTLFQDICSPMQQSFVEQYPNLKPIYDKIQAHNAESLSAES